LLGVMNTVKHLRAPLKLWILDKLVAVSFSRDVALHLSSFLSSFSKLTNQQNDLWNSWKNW
jgi:hypothetical protein